MSDCDLVLGPNIPASVFVCDTARIAGNVTLGDECSVWFGAVLRGDAGTITVGAKSNIQDNATVHADPGFPCTIGEEVTVGHNAVVHGCTVGDACLIGMGSVVLNGAVLGAGSVVGAGAVVAAGAVVPEGSLVVGVPARIIRSGDARLAEQNRLNATVYDTLRTEYLRGRYATFAPAIPSSRL